MRSHARGADGRRHAARVARGGAADAVHTGRAACILRLLARPPGPSAPVAPPGACVAFSLICAPAFPPLLSVHRPFFIFLPSLTCQVCYVPSCRGAGGCYSPACAARTAVLPPTSLALTRSRRTIVKRERSLSPASNASSFTSRSRAPPPASAPPTATAATSSLAPPLTAISRSSSRSSTPVLPAPPPAPTITPLDDEPDISADAPSPASAAGSAQIDHEDPASDDFDTRVPAAAARGSKGARSLMCTCGRVFSSGQALGGHRGKCKVPRERMRDRPLAQRLALSLIPIHPDVVAAAAANAAAAAAKPSRARGRSPVAPREARPRPRGRPPSVPPPAPSRLAKPEPPLVLDVGAYRLGRIEACMQTPAAITRVNIVCSLCAHRKVFRASITLPPSCVSAQINLARSKFTQNASVARSSHAVADFAETGRRQHGCTAQGDAAVAVAGLRGGDATV